VSKPSARDPRATASARPAAAPCSPAEPPDLAEADIAAWLARHPDFLARHPELLRALAEREGGGGAGPVVDLRQVMVERLRTELAALRRDRDALLATSRTNLAAQTRIHAAVLDLMNAASFEQFVATITADLAPTLALDAVALCVESERPNRAMPLAGLRLLPVGAVDRFLGPGRAVLLRPAVAAEAAIYGRAASYLVKSDALLRLGASPAAPVGLLALGAREPGHFRPGQGTELLRFLAGAIESTMRAWLDLPAD
jgi:hypothetical protein